MEGVRKERKSFRNRRGVREVAQDDHREQSSPHILVGPLEKEFSSARFLIVRDGFENSFFVEVKSLLGHSDFPGRNPDPSRAIDRFHGNPDIESFCVEDDPEKRSGIFNGLSLVCGKCREKTKEKNSHCRHEHCQGLFHPISPFLTNKTFFLFFLFKSPYLKVGLSFPTPVR